MSSTRNRNTIGNYTLEMQQHSRTFDNMLYEHGSAGCAYVTQLPGLGFNGAAIPANKLSNNSVDIESFMRGIGSTNLVNPATVGFVPELRQLSLVNVFEYAPVIVPADHTYLTNQRPYRP